jgi:hypothetical protein
MAISLEGPSGVVLDGSLISLILYLSWLFFVRSSSVKCLCCFGSRPVLIVAVSFDNPNLFSLSCCFLASYIYPADLLDKSLSCMSAAVFLVKFSS